MSTVVMASEIEARRRQERIRLLASSVRDGIDKIGALVHEAKESNDHEALGYRSWTAYLADTLGAEPLRLNRTERREVVALLAGEGMSTRAIAPIVGAGNATVFRDIRAAGVSSETPEADPINDGDAQTSATSEPDAQGAPGSTSEDAADGATEVVAPHRPESEVTELSRNGTPAPDHALSSPVTGLDGRTYLRPEPGKPRRKALTDSARSAGWDLRKAVERLERIADDDRFARNAEEVAPHLRSHLIHAVEVCQDLLARINPSKED